MRYIKTYIFIINLLHNVTPNWTHFLFSVGEPAAELHWTKLGSSVVLHTGRSLVFEPAQLSDSGEYVCTPSNAVGDGRPAVGKLTVNGEHLFCHRLPAS